ncbi:HNH endonuclease [Pseudomonas moorei]|uniref:HNH endonuclease n=1 Tax=Pseudomonas moorei TaxID=395599 RepID=A0A1H1CNG2_9PSED|nr:HNH endonuclease signature motif containing protein [Pseudomonas moorei]KAB0504731.1 HNH endonuclease [Pseudomonas moorei]SDQ65777.1 HNH endonuclease [Pseudomonas moorei]
MEFYWVNVNGTHKEVLEGNFLWAPLSSPQSNGKKRTLVHWNNVGAVKKGDVIFCCKDKQIYAIAVATADAFAAERPTNRSFNTWSESANGHRVDIDLTQLDRPILRDEIAVAFMDQFDSQTSPSLFTKDGTLTQIYMAHLPARAGVFLLEASGQLADFDNLLITKGASGKKVDKTTRESIVQSRVGQGQFRASLLNIWQGRCALTGIENQDLLVASHIEAWCLADNVARLDPDNGLLLAAHVDRLFDRGLISFADDGSLLVSSRLSQHDRAAFGLDQFSGIAKLSVGNQKYLLKHRTEFGF